MRLVVFLATLVACGDSSSTTAPRQEMPKTVAPGVQPDAAIVVVDSSAVAPLPPSEEEFRPAQVQPQPTPTQGRPGRPIDITLRSTPSGAQVAVDGAVIGNTPAYWMGTADGREHEFVFTMRGYAIARYRFVPLVSGVVHGRLDRMTDDLDAGVAPPPEVVPQRPPGSSLVPPPPAVPPDAAQRITPGPQP